jgi:hypothetical protein
LGAGAGRTFSRRRLYLFAAADRHASGDFRFGRSLEAAYLFGDGVDIYRRFSGNQNAPARIYFKDLNLYKIEIKQDLQDCLFYLIYPAQPVYPV